MVLKLARKPADEAHYRRLPNINLLPEEMRFKLFGRAAVLAALALVVELAVLFTLNQSMDGQQLKVTQLRQQLAPLKASLAEVRANLPEIQRLNTEIDSLSRSGRDLARLPTFAPLPSAFAGQVFSGASGNKVSLGSVSQTASGAALVGEGETSAGVLEYVRFLQKLPVVRSVTLQALSRRTGTVEKRETVEVEKQVLKDVFNQAGELINQELVVEKVKEERVVKEEIVRYPFSMLVTLK